MNIRITNLQVAPEWKLGVVTSRFNEEITSKLEEGAVQRLKEMGAKDEQILRLSVPGAIEIPLAVQALLKKGCDGVIALGAVIRGETSHYDYVCNAVERGCSTLMLEHGKPVAFSVLTTDTDEQAVDRIGGKHGHKGKEGAEVTVEMIQLLRELSL
jgi:6,7-dimethyl-8-ribityllumazine synthase